MRSSPGTCSTPDHQRRQTTSSFRRLAATQLAGIICFASALLLVGCGPANFLGGLNPGKPPTSGPPTAGQSGSVTISPQYVALAPGQKFQFTATSSSGGQLEWLVNGVVGGSAAIGTVSSSGKFTAPIVLPLSQNITVTVALAASPTQNYATAVVAVILPANVTCPGATNNPQVALYSLYLPAPGKMSVEFGTTTSYGLNTWKVATPSPNGGQVQTYVAGMLGKTPYHMRAQVTLSNGATYTDADHTCTTGTPPPTSPIQISTTEPPRNPALRCGTPPPPRMSPRPSPPTSKAT